MNFAVITGYIGNDIETRYTQEQKAVASFSVGVRQKDKTEWIKCVAWEKTAEFISKYFHKGSFIAITRRIQTRNYEDKDGKTTYVTEIVVATAEFGGSKKEEKEEITHEFMPQFDNSELPF